MRGNWIYQRFQAALRCFALPCPTLLCPQTTYFRQPKNPLSGCLCMGLILAHHGVLL
ncbi:hypothetical protein [Kingella sp. (in: b-proteobacteria)]|uniref:hypothetical protein n=1 Tax=Kingella sp. (in: b-proteobacteria) TaxID=2020713 RepID=UPI0026DB877C|nr:hypothetical protein [Kingella sp. (in: b-proteobacteria)]MDO4657188.1 hypothetical protein [Kingella sp. (in: b-proteobacteria)]